MFKFSFGTLFKEEDKDYPFLGALDFGKISEEEPTIEIKPITCNNCGSILFYAKDLEQSANGYKFQCRFCLFENQIDKKIATEFIETVKKQEENEEKSFLLERMKDKQENKEKLMDKMSKEETTHFEAMNAIIDISGSMHGTKIEAVKQSLIKTVHITAAKDPDCQFLLFQFESNIEIYPNPKKKIVVDEGPVMYSEEMLQDSIKKVISKHNTKKISESWKDWQTIIKEISSKSMTALGPALFMGVEAAIFLHEKNHSKKGSKVILLTDGLANVGLGDVESNKSDKNANTLFYKNLAEKSLKNNIIVDVIGVLDSGGGNEVCLNVIGKISDITGGSMVFVKAEELENAFGELTATHYVAKNVIMNVYAPNYLELAEIEGVETFGSTFKNGESITLGAFDSSRAIYLKFKPNKDIELNIGKKAKIQIKLSYNDSMNQPRIKVIEREFEISGEKEEFIKKFRPEIASGYEMSQAQRFQKDMNFTEARQRMEQTKSRNMSYMASYAPSNVDELQQINQVADIEMEDWGKMNEEAEHIKDKQSYYASSMQKSARSSVQEKMKKLRK